MGLNKNDVKKLAAIGRRIHSRLKSYGLYTKSSAPETMLEENKISYGEGYPIIGIEKFLGYYDANYNIAYSPSISITTDFSKCKAFCAYSKTGRDEVLLDGVSSEKYSKRMEKALSIFKKENGIKGSFRFYIIRDKRYADAKGLGESAAVASASSEALVRCTFGNDAIRDRKLVSRYARLVSGSGTRSASGVISMWLSYPGIKSGECYAEQMDIKHNKIHLFTLPERSTVETIGAHEAAKRSDFYREWLFGKYERFSDNTRLNHINSLLSLAEKDTLRLDAVLLSGGMFVHNDKSLYRIKKYMEFKESNKDVYMSADTGPSLVFISENMKSLRTLEKSLDGNALYGNVPENRISNPKAADLRLAQNFLLAV